MNKIILLRREGWKHFKVPVLIFSPSLLLGVILGVFAIQPSSATVDIATNQMSTFSSILLTNSTIIISIYISVIFTSYYAYFVYALNGIVLGLFTGWIFSTDAQLLWLLIPHGVFEIIYLLATGFILSKGEHFIRNNFKRYLLLLFIHLVAVFICTIIEAFITPTIYNLMRRGMK